MNSSWFKINRVFRETDRGFLRFFPIIFRLPFFYVFACQILKAERESHRDNRIEVGRMWHALYMKPELSTVKLIP